MVATSRQVDREALELRAHRAADVAQKLRELSATDGWDLLRETFARQREQYYERLARDLMAGKEIDQRKLDYNRGFFESVEQLLEAPHNAEAILEKAVKRLRARVLEEESSKE